MADGALVEKRSGISFLALAAKMVVASACSPPQPSTLGRGTKGNIG